MAFSLPTVNLGGKEFLKNRAKIGILAPNYVTHKGPVTAPLSSVRLSQGVRVLGASVAGGIRTIKPYRHLLAGSALFILKYP